MSLHFSRDSCPNCHQALPRSAAFRCPFCLEPFELEISAAGEICPLCREPIPRAHAGKCPCTAIASHAQARNRRRSTR